LKKKFFILKITKKKAMVGIFFVKSAEKLEREQKKEKRVFRNWNIDVEKFVQILNEGCFDVISYYETPLHSLVEKLIKKKIFSKKKPVLKN
jgi:hypothetical protein